METLILKERDLEDRRASTRGAVTRGSALTGSYLAMNAAATLIAGLGLLQNSAVVIIGAMLIAMLFGPIVGIALALAEGNLALLGRSLLSEIAGIAWVLTIGFVVGLVAQKLSIGTEVLSRSSPNLLDLLIGLVGGIAGAFTYVAPGLSGVVVGVAIATSLVPPLTSCGILLAHHLPALAGGAFLLFLANFSAITIGAMGVFWLAGYRPKSSGPAQRVLIPRSISLFLLLVLGVHFTVTFRRTIAHSILENGIKTTLSREIVKLPGAGLVAVTMSPGPAGNVAWVIVRTPHRIRPDQVARLNDLVNAATGSAVDLHVRSVITEETTRSGYVDEPPPVPAEEAEAR